MVTIHDITNTIFSSKTYILSKEGYDRAWIIDVGDIDPLVRYLDSCHLGIEGILITHAHFDHIYGLNDLVKKYPDCKVYVTEYSKEALASDKLNLSKYHGQSILYVNDNIVVVHDGERIKLFEDEPTMEFYETPGHNPGCLSMSIGNVFFTGDSYIPRIGVDTRLPRSNKQQAQQSLERILTLSEGKVILCGH
ncbi:MAG: MBL fold metallo-hydrolase [Bacteroidales bacterium]|nr:MBL fold metallo-hydrolase [Bacteroidales bacterium]